MEISDQKIRQLRHKVMMSVEIALILLTVVLILAGFIRILPALIRMPDSYDFGAYYVAARVLNAHEALYDDARMADAATIGGEKLTFPRYIYPPFFAATLRPIASLPFNIAARIWFFSNLICLFISIGLLTRLIGLSRVGAVSMGLIALVMPPVYDTLLLGQVNLLLLILITASLYLSSRPDPSRGRGILAGILLGVAVSIKLYPIVIGLAFLLRRRFVPFISMLFGMVIMLFFGIIAGGGMANTFRYFNEVLPGFSGGDPGVADQSIWSVMARLFSFNHYRFAFLTTTNFVDMSLAPVINAPGVGYFLSLLGTILIVTFTMLVLITRSIRDPESNSLLPEFSLLIILTLLTFPIVHDHYLSLLLIPVSLVTWDYLQARQTSAKRSIRIILIIFCLLLALQRYWRPLLNIVPSPLLLCFGFCGMLLLWIAHLRLTMSALNQPSDTLEGTSI